MDKFKDLIAAVTGALRVVTTVGNVPGVNLIPYVNTVTSAAEVIAFAIEKGANVASHIAALTETFSGGLPSQDKQDALDAKIGELRTKVHAPLPPKEDGEED